MKKIIYALGILIGAALLLCSSSPSLDGRALVAKDGDFPPGLFAKTVGYLPGDSINVTNPANGEKVDILVIGALDPSEGVAILLSPEAASTLGIKRDSNNLVKLTKRTGSADEVVNGTAVLALNDETASVPEEIVEPAKDEESPLEAEEPETITEAVPSDDQTPEKFEEITESEVEPESEVIAAVVPVEDEGEEEINEEPEEVSEEPEEVAVIDEVQETEEADEEEAENEIPEDVVREESAVAEKFDEDEIAEPVELSSEEEEVAEAPEDDEENELEEQYTDDNEEEAIVLVPADEEKVNEPAIESDEKSEIAEEKFDDEPIAAPVEEKEEIAEAATEESTEPAVETEPVKESESVAESETKDTYEAIVLVPSDANPPASESAAEPVSEEETIVKTPEPVVEPEPKAVSTNSKLEKGKYYVQIAVYSKKENAEETAIKYRNYPLTVLSDSSKQTVLVGPLDVDEYGTVLERFRAFGFKDAFIRKGK